MHLYLFILRVHCAVSILVTAECAILHVSENETDDGSYRKIRWEKQYVDIWCFSLHLLSSLSRSLWLLCITSSCLIAVHFHTSTHSKIRAFFLCLSSIRLHTESSRTCEIPCDTVNTDSAQSPWSSVELVQLLLLVWVCAWCEYKCNTF